LAFAAQVENETPLGQSTWLDTNNMNSNSSADQR